MRHRLAAAITAILLGVIALSGVASAETPDKFKPGDVNHPCDPAYYHDCIPPFIR